VNDSGASDLLSRIFPPSVATAEATQESPHEPLFPEEEAAVRSAVAKRQREFRAGCAGARAALRKLGLPPQPLPVGPRRAPVWPEGVMGSITHTRGFCAAAAAWQQQIAGLGVDAEQRGAVQPSLPRHIATEVERAWMTRTPPPPRGDWPTLLFSAKESLYKTLAARRGHTRIPDFRDAVVPAPPEREAFRIELRGSAWPSWVPRTVESRFVFYEAHVVTGICIRPPVDFSPTGRS